LATDNLFIRDEALGGLPARRANTLLFLIESRTAHLAARSRWAMERVLTEPTVQERELAFVEAFALGREPPLRPTVQHLERYAPQWAPLVPQNPALRAALAHLLGSKYRLVAARTENIRAALGLDQAAVQQAYQRSYHRPLGSIYVPRVTFLERLRWASARLVTALESMPPFWAAFAITLTETVGAGTLALPIAVAGIGPLPGIALLALMGLLNVLTVAAMAEAISRNGGVRYGGAYLGRMVADYLGGAGSLVLSLGLVVLNVAALMSFLVGLSTTLAAATGVPAPVWVAALFLVVLYLLRRKEMNATIASALLVGFSSIALILLLSALALTHLSLENLRYVQVPFLHGEPLRPALLELIFGSILFAYFGHTSMGSCARVVLRRDPSARSLIYGAAAAILASTVLYSTWVLAVNGSVPAQVLATEQGTSLVPLAARMGPVVAVLGSVYVVLSIAMASLHMALGLFNVVRERLPARQQPVLVLPRRRARLLLRPRGSTGRAGYLALTYLGPGYSRDDAPRFRLKIALDPGRTGNAGQEVELVLKHHWDVQELGDRFAELAQSKVHLALELLDAQPESVCLRVSSSLAIAYEGEWDGGSAHLADLLEMPDDARKLVQEMMRRPSMTLAELAVVSGREEDALRPLLAGLMEKGSVHAVEEGGHTVYRVRWGSRGKRRLPDEVWRALDDAAPKDVAPSPRGSAITRGPAALAPRQRSVLQSEPLRFMLCVSPTLAVFLLIEWQLLTGRESFSGPLSLAGVLVASALAGIFPVLLLAASRRKGDLVPGVAWRWLGHPVVLGIVYVIYLASILLHGLVIWSNPWQRALALLVGVGLVALTVATVRRRMFTRRMVIELREEKDGEGQAARSRLTFSAVAAGRPSAVDISLHYPEGEDRRTCSCGEVSLPGALREMRFYLPARPGEELKVWGHRETPDAPSEALPILLEVHEGDQVTRHDLQLTGGQVVLPPCATPRRLSVTLAAAQLPPTRS
jgi:amino acid permease